MNTKICLIKENSLVYSDSGYAILSAGTPVMLQGVIKDPESGEEVASIINDKGNPYKMLDADLIHLNKEEINLLLDDSLPLSCLKHKKAAEKLLSLLKKEEKEEDEEEYADLGPWEEEKENER